MSNIGGQRMLKKIPPLINKIIKVLIVSDFFLNAGWGMLGPIFAIFIVEQIAVHNVSEAAKVAGFATLFFWITKSLVQIPLGYWLDINHGEKDDYWCMVVGSFMMALVPLGYLFATQAWHLYLLQIFYGTAAAINFPSWSAIFTRHIDKGREALEWGTHSTFLGMGAGLAGGIGGVAVAIFGFSVVFVFVSIFTFISGLLLLLIRDDVSLTNKKVPRIPVEKTAP